MPSLLEMNTFIVGFIKGIAYDVKWFCKDHFFFLFFNFSDYFQDCVLLRYTLKAKQGTVFYCSLPKMQNYKQVEWQQGKGERATQGNTQSLSEQGQLFPVIKDFSSTMPFVPK